MLNTNMCEINNSSKQILYKILIRNVFKTLSFSFVVTMLIFPSCKQKNIRSEKNMAIECAIKKLMADTEFSKQLISGQNFIFWKKESYIDYNHISCYNKLTEWSSLPALTPDKKILQSLELNLPKLKNIQWIDSVDYEKTLMENRNKTYCIWSVAGLKNCGNRYFLEAGFMVSSVAGTGAFFIIDIKNNSCEIIEYSPVIF
jgi:hypothetical protein